MGHNSFHLGDSFALVFFFVFKMQGEVWGIPNISGIQAVTQVTGYRANAA